MAAPIAGVGPADRFGLQTSFLITASCELDVLFYAVWGCRAPRAA